MCRKIIGTACLVCLCVAAVSTLFGRTPEEDQLAEIDTTASTVEVKMKIIDDASGFRLEAKKKVARGTSGFDALRAVIQVEYRHLPSKGVFVETLCGVAPAENQFWSLIIDGEMSKKGISNITLDKDTTIEWKTRGR